MMESEGGVNNREAVMSRYLMISVYGLQRAVAVSEFGRASA